MDSKKLIHVASITLKNKGQSYVYLHEVSPQHYVWFLNGEKSPIEATTVEEAIRIATAFWKNDHFRTVKCGFRYTLPERDEHGSNALFHQMVASYTSMNGIYFDEELGNNCIVHNASLEAKALLKNHGY